MAHITARRRKLGNGPRRIGGLSGHRPASVLAATAAVEITKSSNPRLPPGYSSGRAERLMSIAKKPPLLHYRSFAPLTQTPREGRRYIAFVSSVPRSATWPRYRDSPASVIMEIEKLLPSAYCPSAQAAREVAASLTATTVAPRTRGSALFWQSIEHHRPGFDLYRIGRGGNRDRRENISGYRVSGAVLRLATTSGPGQQGPGEIEAWARHSGPIPLPAGSPAWATSSSRATAPSPETSAWQGYPRQGLSSMRPAGDRAGVAGGMYRLGRRVGTAETAFRGKAWPHGFHRLSPKRLPCRRAGKLTMGPEGGVPSIHPLGEKLPAK